MLWLYLLGTVTVLVIVLRRVLRRQIPLSDELFSKKVAVEYVQSGVAWVRGDGTLGAVNQSLADTLRSTPADLMGKEWYKIFPPEEHSVVRDGYSQMLLVGVYAFDGPGQRVDGSRVWLNIKLVAAADHKARYVGHYCLVQDRTRERELEEQVRSLTAEKKPAPKLQVLVKRSS
jgi:PAS domain S-box-containing protein